MRVMIAGGGTGGHTSPALAVVEELRRRDPAVEFQWVGRRGGIEDRMCKAAGIPFRHVPVEGWPRSRSPRKLWVAAKLAWSIARCFWYIRRFRPDVAFGVGGYVSLPLLYAAQRAGIPTVIHEQNRLMGMANRVLAPRATRVFLSYDDTKGRYPADRAAVVGNPVRSGFATPPDRAAARAALDLDSDVPVVFVCGGSQGSRTLNLAMTGALPEFAPDEAQFIWMAGRFGIDDARPVAEAAKARALVFDYIDDMVGACAASDVFVSRAGASSTAEIALLGLPSLLVPYPGADNHQEENARALEDAGAAMVLLDHECTPDRFAELVREFLSDPARLDAMRRASKGLGRPDAANAIADGIQAVAERDSSLRSE